MPPYLKTGQKKIIIGLSYVVFLITGLFIQYNIWYPSGWLAHIGITYKIIATILAFPICILVTILVGIFVQIIVEFVVTRR